MARARMLCTSSQSVNVDMMPMSARTFPVHQHTKVGREHQQESRRVSQSLAWLRSALDFGCFLCFACEDQPLRRSHELRLFECNRVTADSFDMSHSNFLICFDPSCGVKRCETMWNDVKRCALIYVNRFRKNLEEIRDFAGVLRNGAGAAELLLDGDLTKPSGLDGGGSREFPGAEPWRRFHGVSVLKMLKVFLKVFSSFWLAACTIYCIYIIQYIRYIHFILRYIRYMEYIFLAWLWPLMMSLTFLDSGIWVWITWWWLDGTCKRASRLPYRPLLPVLPCHIFSCRFADCLQFITSVHKCLRCEVCCFTILHYNGLGRNSFNSNSTRISVQCKCHFLILSHFPVGDS